MNRKSMIRCPLCHRECSWEKNPWRPFCSERCQIIDLGAWASERYRIPVEASDSDQEASVAPEGNS
ncbi:MAG: DNA gyrase inhibitor YacG [Nitrospirae bacterium]|nr:DNA gyrase inhibitor YacG [Nitrospirota bacterium]